MKRYLIIIFVILFISCSKKSEQREQQGIQEVSIKVITTEIQTYTPTLKFTGNLVANKKASLSPSIPGKVEQFYVDIGDSVNKNDLLVRFSGELLVQSNAQFNAIKADYDRAVSLFESDLISQQSFDHAESAYLAAQAQRNISYNATIIRAPFPGTITAKMIEEGEMYIPSPTMSAGEIIAPGVIRIVNIDTVKVEIDVSENDYQHLKKHSQAELRVDLFPDTFWLGEITTIDISINVRTRTIPIELSFSNPSHLLKSGMFGDITIKLQEREAIWIPEQCIVREIGTEKYFVYIIDENYIANKREIIIGSISENQTEIIAGLDPGEIITSVGVGTLKDGDEVLIIEDNE